MATTPVQTPPRPSNGRAQTPATPSLLKGDEAVPRGLAVSSAITLRALIVQGAAAAQTDDETRTRLRDEQEAHINSWLEAYERERDRMGIEEDVDMAVFVLCTWAIELGLGVLESMGVAPPSPKAWADIHNRIARSLQLPADERGRNGARPRKRR